MNLKKEKKSVSNNMRIIEQIYQKNLWYPNTIINILEKLSCHNLMVDSMSEESLNCLINNVEQFCHNITMFEEINSFNISKIALLLVDANETLREMMIVNEPKKLVFSAEKGEIYNIILNELEKIDFSLIESQLESEALCIVQEFNLNENYNTKTDQELESVLLELIRENNFAFSDILTKFFLELDINYYFKFRKMHKTRNLKKDKIHFLLLLNYINNLFYELNKLFKRNNMFLYSMLQENLFGCQKLKEYFLDILSSSINYNNIDFYNELSYRNRGLITKNFIGGLIHLNSCYIIEFSSFNNCNTSSLIDLPDIEKMKIMMSFSSNLDDATLATIFEMNHIEFPDILNYIKQIDLLAKDISHKKKDILLTRQEVTGQQKELIMNFVSKLNKYSIKYENFILGNLMQIGKELVLLYFNLLIEDEYYNVKLIKKNKDLFWYAYDGSQKILRDVCVCESDLKRLYIRLANYKKIKEEKKLYNLI